MRPADPFRHVRSRERAAVPPRASRLLGTLLLVAAAAPWGLGAGPGPLPGRAAAQEGERTAVRTEPFTSPDHWSRDALRRLAGVGLLDPGEVATAWPVPRSRVRALLARAAVREASGAFGDDGGGPPTGRLARGLLRRFDAEYPEPDRNRDRGLRTSGRVDGGWTGASGGRLGGIHEPLDEGGWVYGGPVAAPEVASPLVRPEVELSPAPGLGVRASVLGRSDGIRGQEVYAFGRLGPAELWAGRRHLSFGPPTGRGVVLSGRVPFDGGGVDLMEGVRLPGFLERLGPVRGSASLARMDRSGHVQRPWFWAARVSFAPRDDLVVGLNRAALFGGEGNEPVNFRNVGLMLLGFTETGSKSSDFENQVASVDFVWRLRGSPLPLLLHGEWGFADVGGAWFRVPGIVAGLEVPAVPGVPAVALGVEHASFSGSGRGHPPWYRHGPLGEGWTDRGRLLGHPMGGHGTEWGGHLAADPPSLPVSGVVRLYRRSRGEENLLARSGAEAGAGGELRLVAHGPHRLLLEGGFGWESARPDAGGERWREWSARIAAGVGF